ncbi:solute carrier family 22 member 20 isoform X2 [Procambarus clarkii]|uniref:solute carrier family 22 member 20 isoform X2 n=1 Tax=Procambarus clarkii TaxID=6728 RepID=UPI001E6714C0|nr:solute carrier family 22 member 20-like isoform X2 [Procambarus clarkii]
MSGDDNFDDVLSALGFGRWQIPSLLVTVLAMSQFSVHLIGSPLLCAPLPYRCSLIPPILSNVSSMWQPSSDFDEKCLLFPSSTNATPTTTTTTTNLTAPFIVTTIDAASTVNKFTTTTRETSGGASITTTTTTAAPTTTPTTTTAWRITGLPSCPLIQYDTTVFTSTVISEWDLVCERGVLRPLFQTLFTLGGMLGSTMGGHIGDRWGRRRAVVGACVANLLVVVAMALTPYFPLLVTLRFVAGCSVMAMLVPAWSLTLESTPAGCRSRVGMLLGLPFSASTMGFAGVGFLIRSWRPLLLVCSSPILILLPVALLTDESPRWLVQQARLEEAALVLQKAFRQNKVQLSASLATLMDHMVQESKASSSSRPSPGPCPLPAILQQMWAYLRAPAMRTIIIVTPTLWFLQSCLYLGVVINANNFTSSDPFLYLALTGVMEALAIVIITPLTAHLGRRIMVWVGLGMGGVFLMLELFVPADSEYYWVDWVVVMIGFLLVAGAFQVNYVYAPELFPTEARARGFAFVNVLGSVGFSCAPLITHILEEYAWWAVSVTFGCAGILGSLLVPFLPETNNKPLPETLQDVENRYKYMQNQKRSARRALHEGEMSHTNLTPLLETAPSGHNTPESPHLHLVLETAPNGHNTPETSRSHPQHITPVHGGEGHNATTNGALISSVL